MKQSVKHQLILRSILHDTDLQIILQVRGLLESKKQAELPKKQAELPTKKQKPINVLELIDYVNAVAGSELR